ncbi:MAG: ABC transporter permease [Spirochaetia bacterium]|nr:ABC transporter permease [Spirochaetia bacterium]MCF7953330.1 ABC transporter permease [Spirochaetales bacterium]
MNVFHSKRRLFFLLGPGTAFLLLFFLSPLAYVLVESFRADEGFITLARYQEVLVDQQFRKVFLRTLRMALIVTPLAVLLGYPSAYLMTKLPARKKSILTSLVILPLMTSPVARTYAWIVILGKYGIINETMVRLGFMQEPTRLLYTEGAIIVGLLQLFMPLMVLTLVSAMENSPEEVEEAALSLGSNRIGSFFRVVVPLSFEGLMMGVTLVFTGCFTAYVTPAILGGAKVLTLSTLMRQKALVLMNWEAATVIAVIMILTTLVLYNGVRMFRPRTLV